MSKFYISNKIFNKPVCIQYAIRFVFLWVLSSPIHSFAQSLSLPFFDDFSQNSPQPNQKLWLNEGGCLQNQTMAINPPTVGIITFDGKKSDGIPYTENDKFAFGSTDYIISKPIDLSKYTSKDSVLFSFYWQAKGLGELPDNEDNLRLSFLSKNNEWIKVWQQSGGDSLKGAINIFKQAFVFLQDATLFHSAFQFKFETDGRQSGAFDTWHLDVVYLNANRSISRNDITERACMSLTGTYLKNYSAMPINQFKVNAKNEVNDVPMKGTAFDFKDDYNDNSGYQTIYWDNINKKTIYTSPNNPLIFRYFPNENIFERQLTKNLSIYLIDFNAPKYDFNVYFKINSGDAATEKIKGIDFAANDSVSHHVVLDNYFAYDDGTAESGADVDTKLSKVAVKFKLNQDDYLNAVRVSFSPYFKNQEGQNFFLQIYANDTTGHGNRPGKLLHQQSFKVVNPSKINEFTEYKLSKNIAVSNVFYIGWTKVADEVIAIGIDKNTPQFASNIFFNISGSSWIQNDSLNLKGSLMVRAVMGKDSIGTGETITSLENLPSEHYAIYPNPTTQYISWNIPDAVNVQIFGQTGALLLEKYCLEPKLDVSSLETGHYIIKFNIKNQVISKKLIISK